MPGHREPELAVDAVASHGVLEPRPGQGEVRVALGEALGEALVGRAEALLHRAGFLLGVKGGRTLVEPPEDAAGPLHQRVGRRVGGGDLRRDPHRERIARHVEPSALAHHEPGGIEGAARALQHGGDHALRPALRAGVGDQVDPLGREGLQQAVVEEVVVEHQPRGDARSEGAVEVAVPREQAPFPGAGGSAGIVAVLQECRLHEGHLIAQEAHHVDRLELGEGVANPGEVGRVRAVGAAELLAAEDQRAGRAGVPPRDVAPRRLGAVRRPVRGEVGVPPRHQAVMAGVGVLQERVDQPVRRQQLAVLGERVLDGGGAGLVAADVQDDAGHVSRARRGARAPPGARPRRRTRCSRPPPRRRATRPGCRARRGPSARRARAPRAGPSRSRR